MRHKKQYSFIELFIRSFIFSVFSIISVCMYSLLVAFSWPLPLRYRFAEIRFFLRLYMRVLKLICHIDYKVEGLHHIPKNHRMIIFSKHQSTWETFFLPLLFHDPAIILKRELLWLPFFGWGLAMAKPIAINRTSGSTAMQQIIQKGKAYLDAGRPILVFPEGTRVGVGQVGKYKIGGARLAEATGYPVLPVAHNAGYCWPRRKFIKQPGTIKVVIGPLIESKGRTAEEILNAAKGWIEDTVSKMDSHAVQGAQDAMTN